MNLVEYLVNSGMASSVFEARGLILAGKVLVNDTPAVKEGALYREGDLVRIRGRKEFVSRSGGKLAPLLERWKFPVAGADVADIGSSTGGFTQTLLEHGANRVLAIDVGYGLLAEPLRRDPRVFLLERTNFLHLTKEQLPFLPRHFTADVSFISLRQILPKLNELRCSGPTSAALLFKPQFEIPRGEAELLEKGILRDTKRALQLLDDFCRFATEAGWEISHREPAPVKGRKGNQEYFLCLEKKE